MWKYIKKLEYPVNIQRKDLKMAKNLLAQYGGPYIIWDYTYIRKIKSLFFCKFYKNLTNFKIGIDITYVM